jgi:hypothetical protein
MTCELGIGGPGAGFARPGTAFLGRTAGRVMAIREIATYSEGVL